MIATTATNKTDDVQSIAQQHTQIRNIPGELCVDSNYSIENWILYIRCSSKRSARIPFIDFGIKCGASGAKRKEKAAEEKEEERTQEKEKESAKWRENIEYFKSISRV